MPPIARCLSKRLFSALPKRPVCLPASFHTNTLTKHYATSSSGKPKGAAPKSPFPVIPLIAILAAGSGAFYLMVQSRKGSSLSPGASRDDEREDWVIVDYPLEPLPAIEEPAKNKEISAGDVKKPAFGPGEVSVIFVLGGPGVGKGTQCHYLVRDFGFVHLSAGDLLRAEQNREGSEFGELIKTYIREGKIVPMEVTVALLENAMKEAIATQKKTKFLIDGFPRQMDQALKFENEVAASKFTLFFECSEETMLERLLNRGKTSGRIDDNIESIKKRFNTFQVTSMPVVEFYEKQSKIVRIDASSTPDGVYSQVKKELTNKLNADLAQSSLKA